MRYLSVCSGIEAATVAWHPLRWEPVAFSEIEGFPAAVLNYHYPDVLNLGDMTKFKEWTDATVDILVGGTPCQSFSVAGLRKGLDDPRGNLMLTYLAIAVKYRPKWVVWENVPGVLSSNGGRDFATFFRGLEECGYGVAYRVLDAQYFGVAQRRRRVFVVGCLGSWQRAAAVLFERDSLCGNTAPSRETGQVIAGTIAKCSFSGGAGGRPEGAAGNHFLAIGVDEECNASIEHFGPLLRGGQGGTRQAVAYSINGSMINRQDHNGPNGKGWYEEECPTMTKCDVHAVAFAQNTRDEVRYVNGDGSIAGALAAEPGMKQTTYIMSTGQAGAEIGIGIGTTLNCNHEPPIAFTSINDGRDAIDNITPTLGCGGGGGYGAGMAVSTRMQVRRLTPVECERLQGFPDGYTSIPWRSKPESPDGPRYKALGNSMAVPVMRWIGGRIQMVENIISPSFSLEPGKKY